LHFLPNYLFSAILRGLSLRNGLQVWIGLSDQAREGNFVWVNGEQASYNDDSLWYPGQPNNSGDCCSTLFGLARVASFDEPCYYTGFPAICEKPV